MRGGLGGFVFSKLVKRNGGVAEQRSITYMPRLALQYDGGGGALKCLRGILVTGSRSGTGCGRHPRAARDQHTHFDPRICTPTNLVHAVGVAEAHTMVPVLNIETKVLNSGSALATTSGPRHLASCDNPEIFDHDTASTSLRNGDNTLFDPDALSNTCVGPACTQFVKIVGGIRQSSKLEPLGCPKTERLRANKETGSLLPWDSISSSCFQGWESSELNLFEAVTSCSNRLICLAVLN
jgi:hypothetical protein